MLLRPGNSRRPVAERDVGSTPSGKTVSTEDDTDAIRSAHAGLRSKNSFTMPRSAFDVRSF